MTELLKQAFDKASTLPEELQDVIAEELLADIEAEGRWDETFKKTGDKLGKLADKALEEWKTKVKGGKMELKIKIPKDEEIFVKDDFGLFLAKKGFMKKLIEIEMAEKLAAESKLTGDDVEELSGIVKDGLYKRVKSL